MIAQNNDNNSSVDDCRNTKSFVLLLFSYNSTIIIDKRNINTISINDLENND